MTAQVFNNIIDRTPLSDALKSSKLKQKKRKEDEGLRKSIINKKAKSIDRLQRE
jgi:hypothetical protein